MFENIPVDIYEVRDCILERKVVDEIKFVGANMDPAILRGAFRRFQDVSFAYGTGPRDVVRIYYANTMSKSWMRLVCCKEMMHIYDVTQAHSLTEDNIHHLIEGLALREFAPISSSASQAVHALKAEAGAYLLALHLLAPDATIELLRPDFLSGKLSEIEVAAKLELPTERINFIFSPEYRRLLDKCLDAIDGHKFKHPDAQAPIA